MTGLILFVAGASKALGWFGGFGMKTTVQMFKSGMNISEGWAYISTYAELIGGLLLLIGFLTRPAAFILVINMVAATLLTGFANFFMGGAAYPCLLAITSFVLLLSGPMQYSIDALLSKERIIR
jgi:putative oxidoreductase